MRTLSLIAATSLTAAALALAGCGSGSKPAATQNPNDQMVKFAQCMRQHGINVPDPKNGHLEVSGSGGAGTKAKVDAAIQACQKYAPKEMSGPASSKDRDHALKMAECLRKHGVNAADPPPGQADVQVQGSNGDRAKVDQARQACEKQVGG
jgi:hypothetical protein